MCKGACEGSCSPEVAVGCPVLQTVQKFTPDTSKVLDDTWRELEIAMQKEDATMPLARIFAKNMI